MLTVHLTLVPRALGQNDPSDHLLIFNPLHLFRSLKEWDLQHEALSALLRSSQKLLQLSVPANLEVVVPASENRISRLQLQVGFPRAGAEARSGHISNIVDKVSIQAARHERKLQFLQCRSGRVVITALLVRNSGEVVLERGSTVRHPVSLLGCEVSTPMRDLDVPLQKLGVGQGFGEFVSQADFLHCARFELAVRSICKSRALPLRILFALSIERRGKSDDAGHIGGGELELGLLLESRVGGWRVCGECMLYVLLVVLADLSGKWRQSAEDIIRDGERQLL